MFIPRGPVVYVDKGYGVGGTGTLEVVSGFLGHASVWEEAFMRTNRRDDIGRSTLL